MGERTNIGSCGKDPLVMNELADSSIRVAETTQCSTYNSSSLGRHENSEVFAALLASRNKKTIQLDPTKRKLFLIFHGRFPSEKAAALFAAKSAEAFATLGQEVVLLVPRRFGRFKESAYDFYGLERNFKIVFLPTLDLFALPFIKRFAFGLSFIFFSVFSFSYLIFRARREDIIYSNESLPLVLLSFAFPNTVYEIHDFPRNNFYYRVVFRRVTYFVATNHWKKRKLQEIFNIPGERIITEQNAVSLEDFSDLLSKFEARKILNLSSDTKLICYVGMLRTMGMEKGMDILLKAVKSITGFKLMVVGGNYEDLAFYKNVAEEYGITDRVIFAGFVPYKKVALYLSASDILVAPFPKNDHYEFYMSPMKIFEYMASRRPIVTTDLGSIREILDDDTAVFVRPDDQENLGQGILKLLNDEELGVKIADRAYRKVLQHTWAKRAERIIKFLDV